MLYRPSAYHIRDVSVPTLTFGARVQVEARLLQINSDKSWFYLYLDIRRLRCYLRISFYIKVCTYSCTCGCPDREAGTTRSIHLGAFLQQVCRLPTPLPVYFRQTFRLVFSAEHSILLISVGGCAWLVEISTSTTRPVHCSYKRQYLPSRGVIYIEIYLYIGGCLSRKTCLLQAFKLVFHTF